MSVVRDFIILITVKQRSERSQRFHFNNSEIKQRSKLSQRLHFKNSEVKRRSKRGQDFFLITMK